MVWWTGEKKEGFKMGLTFELRFTAFYLLLPHLGFLPVPGSWLCLSDDVCDSWTGVFNVACLDCAVPFPPPPPREVAVWFYPALVLRCGCWCSLLSSGWDLCLQVSGTSLVVEQAKGYVCPKPTKTVEGKEKESTAKCMKTLKKLQWSRLMTEERAE